MSPKQHDEPAIVAIDITSRMGVIDEAECLALMASTPVGRLGFNTDTGPLVLPVNFAVTDGSIVFRTVEGQKLAAAAEGQAVCFEVDEWTASERTGWSVVVTGIASEVTDGPNKRFSKTLGSFPGRGNSGDRCGSRSSQQTSAGVFCVKRGVSRCEPCHRHPVGRAADIVKAERLAECY